MEPRKPISAPAISYGTAFWLVFALIALWLRGVRWDENYEFAQAMTGALAYPEGHPIVVYTRNVFNGQFALAGLMERLFDSLALLNGYRNYLFIAASVVPPFLLGAIASGRAILGHIAAVLVLHGLHLEFDGAYPQMLWPGMFSNGHVATGYALATVALFAGGYIRIASLLLGLMPLVHLGQAPALMLLGLVFGAVALLGDDRSQLKSGLPWLVAGLVLCAVVFVVIRAGAVEPATTGAYAGTLDPGEAWRGIVQHHDMHRRIPIGNSHIIPFLFAAVWFFGGRNISDARKRAWNWLGVYGACVIAIVYGVMAAHTFLGESAPYLLIGWLPYRLANHLPPILIALAAAGVWFAPGDSDAREQSGPGPWIVVAVLAFLLLRPWLGPVIPENLFSRYLSSTGSMMFLLCGAAIAVHYRSGAARNVRVASVVTGAGILILLGVLHQFGAACFLAGMAAGGLTARLADRKKIAMPSPLVPVSVLLFVLLAGILWTERVHRAHLPVGEFERNVADLLMARGEEDAMLAGPPYQLMLQAQTGHPVIADMATHYHGSYMPSVAPSVHALYSRVYGIDLMQPEGAGPNWETVWSNRSADEWRALADDFGFAYVVAPNRIDVKLPKLAEGVNDLLYDVPAAD